jgi:ATP-dependent helicase/nuclease subunit A
MTVAQKKASNPRTSVWVSASAGTGKTKVLVDRLMAILYQGTPISHIICLTFTKAAALEMRERLLLRLQHDALHVPDLSAKAAILLEDLLESPETLKIMTLHAFCISLLQKFPLEAGIAPFFKVIDDHETKQLLMRALDNVLQNPPSADVAAAIEGVSLSLGEFMFQRCFEDAFQKWHNVRHLQRIYSDGAAYRDALNNSFGGHDQPEVPPGLDPDMLAAIIEALQKSSKAPDQKLGKNLMALLEEGVGESADHDHANPMRESVYSPIGDFLTKDGSPRKRIVSADFTKAHPEFADELFEMAIYFQARQNAAAYADWLQKNHDFWYVIQAVLEVFTDLKDDEGLLDYHDLVLHCLALFSDHVDLSFVHQRLDYTIEHILVDEAQDNSPEQWLLIYKLMELFIRDDTPDRTLFVVGDIKQSIYGFQGAAPHLFASLARAFEATLQARGHAFVQATLDDSFRTTPEVLALVDRVFDENPQGMGGTVRHMAYRKDAGWTACHVLSDDDFQTDQGDVGEGDATAPENKTTPVLVQDNGQRTQSRQEDGYAWKILDRYEVKYSSDHILAGHIADDIAGLLASKAILPTTGQPMKPADILVLLRSRGNLGRLLIQHLKQRAIPVEGPDRIDLSSRQAIEDVLAALRFLCLPSDDVSLAHVLKSPLINDGHGYDEETLFALCHGRAGSLWDQLRSNDAHIETTALLKKWLAMVDFETPYTLIAAIIMPAIMAFENRLGKDVHLLFETLLDKVLALEPTYSTLSQMLYELEQSMPTVKRDPTKPTGVRIMTVHGSKGLEAPVVILVDRDDRLNLTKENILWPTVDDAQTGEVVSLFCLKPKAGIALPAFEELRESALEEMREERNRLLYVGLTRARDYLWVVGSGDWIHMIEPHASKDVAAVIGGADRALYQEKVENAAPQTLPEWARRSVLVPPGDAADDACGATAGLAERDLDEGDWVPDEDTEAQKIQDGPKAQQSQGGPEGKESQGGPADKQNQDEVSRAPKIALNIALQRSVMLGSPAENIPASTADRGVLIHHALECICKTHASDHARLWDSMRVKGLSEDDIRTLNHIIQHPEVAHLFAYEAKDSLFQGSEVEFVSDGALHRMDRVIETHDAILVVDYKTGPRPKNGNIPISYGLQLQTYMQILSGACPGKVVKAYLLWTDALMLDEVAFRSS